MSDEAGAGAQEASSPGGGPHPAGRRALNLSRAMLAGRESDTVRRMLSASSLSIAGMAVAFVSQIIRIPIIVASIGAGGYGQVLVVLSLGVWMEFFGTGIQGRVRIRVAEGLAAGDILSCSKAVIAERVRLRNGAVTLSAAAMVVAVSLLLARANGLNMLQMDALHLLLGIEIIILFTILRLPGNLAMALLEADRRTTVAAALALIGSAMSVPLTMAAAALGGSVPGFVLAATLSSVFPYAGAALLVRNSPVMKAVRLKASRDLARADAAKLPKLLALSVIPVASTAASGFDLLIINAILGPVSAAEYGLALRLSALVLAIPAAVRPILWVWIAQKRQNLSSEGFRHQVLLLLGSTACLAMVASLVFMLLGPVVAKSAGKGEIPVSASVYVALGCYVAIFCCHIVSVSVFVSSEYVNAVAVATASAAVLNVGASVLFTKYVGVSGPAVASVLAVGILLCWMLATVARRPERLVRR